MLWPLKLDIFLHYVSRDETTIIVRSSLVAHLHSFLQNCENIILDILYIPHSSDVFKNKEWTSSHSLWETVERLYRIGGRKITPIIVPYRRTDCLRQQNVSSVNEKSQLSVKTLFLYSAAGVLKLEIISIFKYYSLFSI